MNSSIAEAIERDGFAIVADALGHELRSSLESALSGFTGGSRARGVYRRGAVYAIRNLFDFVPEARIALEAPAIREVVSAVLGPQATCVHALYLDRAPRPAWKVPWHQDAAIVVKEKAEVTGFGPWATKGGARHVLAPPGTLSAMLSLKLYLDDSDESSGAMRVVPGSHAYGRLPEDSIESFTRYDVVTCAIAAGGILAMRPLLLHSTGPSKPVRTRIIHLDFCARKLPAPLEWREAHAV
jgi:ectoine hydroxylase-related dioxygenase (phytanoyl-CoA dioxygenase family)